GDVAVRPRLVVDQNRQAERARHVVVDDACIDVDAPAGGRPNEEPNGRLRLRAARGERKGQGHSNQGGARPSARDACETMHGLLPSSSVPQGGPPSGLSLLAGNLGVDAQQLRNGLWSASTKPALGGDREVWNALLCRCHPYFGAVDSIGVVYQPEGQFGLGGELQALERLEVAVVG